MDQDVAVAPGVTPVTQLLTRKDTVTRQLAVIPCDYDFPVNRGAIIDIEGLR